MTRRTVTSPRPWAISPDPEKRFTIVDAEGVEIIRTRPRKMDNEGLERAKADLQMIITRVNR